MTSPTLLRDLADQVERLSAKDDADKALGLRRAISNAVLGLPRMYTPPWHRSFDAARSISTWIITHASDIAADGMAMVELSDTGGPCRPVNIVRGIASTLPAALCAASLRARAVEMEEDNGP